MTDEEKYEFVVKCYAKCFNTPEGQEVLKDLSNSFHEVTSLNEEGNPNKILIQEGKRFVVLYIKSKIEELEILENGRRTKLA